MTLKTLKATLLGCAFALSATASMAEEVKLTMSHYLPPFLGLHKDFMEPWARELEAKTGGKVKIEIQTAGSALGVITKQWDQVVDGVSDIAFGLHGIPRGRFKCTPAIELPFLTDSGEEANEVLWGAFPEFLAEEHSEVKVLALMAHDPGVLATKGKRVEKPADLKGLRIRVPSPFVAAMLEDLGAVPVGMPPGQVYENMSTGAIDGVVLPWAGLSAFKITEIATNAIELGAYTTPFFFIMNKDKYDSLPADVQKAIDETTGDALVGKFAGWWADWGKGGPGQVKDAGGEVISPSAELREQWIASIAPTNAKLEAGLASDCSVGADLVKKVKELAAN